MFLTDAPEVRYTDPWSVSFEQRLAEFSKGNCRVAYFYEKPDSSTFRYRVYNMIQSLQASGGGISAAYFSLGDIERLDPVIRTADTLVIGRARYSPPLAHLITRAKDRGCRVLFDVDDLVFDPTYVHLILDTLDSPTDERSLDLWFASVGRLGATLKLCDGVIVTNAYLAERVRRYADRPTYVIPNFLNREQITLSERIFAAKVKAGFPRSEQIHVGYFSGTPTHNKDFEIVAGALARLMRRDPRIVLRVVGHLELKSHLTSFASRIEFHPFQDFLNLQRLVGTTEINLVPLQDNLFTNCKSELKYFEAAIAGTVTIASPTFTYRAAINDGENGFLANTQDWDAKLSLLLGMMDDYPAIAERAFQHSARHYSWADQAPVIERAVTS